VKTNGGKLANHAYCALLLRYTPLPVAAYRICEKTVSAAPPYITKNAMWAANNMPEPCSGRQLRKIGTRSSHISPSPVNIFDNKHFFFVVTTTPTIDLKITCHSAGACPKRARKLAHHSLPLRRRTPSANAGVCFDDVVLLHKPSSKSATCRLRSCVSSRNASGGVSHDESIVYRFP